MAFFINHLSAKFTQRCKNYDVFLIEIFNRTDKPKSLLIRWGKHLIFQDLHVGPFLSRRIRPPNIENGKFMLCPSEGEDGQIQKNPSFEVIDNKTEEARLFS